MKRIGPGLDSGRDRASRRVQNHGVSGDPESLGFLPVSQRKVSVDPVVSLDTVSGVLSVYLLLYVSRVRDSGGMHRPGVGTRLPVPSPRLLPTLLRRTLYPMLTTRKTSTVDRSRP